MDNKTPRINSTLLSKYVNQTVRVVGKVLNANGREAVIEASDNGHVTIKLHPTTQKFSSTFIEIIGRVGEDLTITELSNCPLEGEVDLQLYNKLVQYSEQYPSLFSE